MKFPGIVISALRGGSGKTLLTLGIISALQQSGKAIAPFKKGPDYIDAGWLGLAAGRPCYNLDTFLIQPAQILQSYREHFRPADMAVIEGNRGLYDCISTDGATSTAELAKLLGLPAIVCIDCTKTTRTMAAVISGLLRFDPEVNLAGVVLNRVAGARHENILKQSIETHCGIPILGAIPKLRKQSFPERHMGLVPTPEHDWARESIAAAGKIATDYLDLDRICEISQNAAMEAGSVVEPADRVAPQTAVAGPRARIGVIRDSAFQFYYPENLEALSAQGAELIFTSPLDEKILPALDALYIGGGFPETHAEMLARNESFRRGIKALADDGGPIYAECGGLMYLGEALTYEDTVYPMCGVLPVVFGFSKKPQGHGYTILKVERENPYFPLGAEIRGHEFHYSRIMEWRGSPSDMAFDVIRGAGFQDRKEGVCYRNVLAAYTHIHATGTPVWAQSMIANARAYRERRNDRS